MILPGKVATLLECFPLTWGTVGKHTSNFFCLQVDAAGGAAGRDAEYCVFCFGVRFGTLGITGTSNWPRLEVSGFFAY